MSSSAERLVFNLRDPAFFGDPYPTYDAMRRRAPIYYYPEHEAWVLTRFADVAAMLKDPRLDVKPFEGFNDKAIQRDDLLFALQQKGIKLLNLWLPSRRQPDHTRVRKLFNKSFSADRIAKLRARMQQLADACIEQVMPHEQMDIVHDLGRPLPFAVTCDILGVPEESRADFRSLAYELHFRINVGPTPAARERSFMAIVGLAQRFQSIIDHCRAQPPFEDNLICELMRAQDEGRLSDEELLAQCSLILIGGYLNTQHLIGNGVLALLRQPDQLEMLRLQPELLSTAIDEFLRYDCPTQLVTRMAVADIELGETKIPKGHTVYLIIGSANRDPEMFPDPDRLDITRNPNPHLSFGNGSHHCLGAALGKMEAQVAIGTLIRRLPRLRLKTEALQWEENLVIHGLKSLPVVFN
jgi:pimeloyl-[acyl-carrier protein] synthase